MKRYLPILAAITGLTGFIAICQPKQSIYFLTTLGRDTIAVEECSMDSHELHGTSVVRSPKTTTRDYSATFGPDGMLMRFHVIYQRYGNQVFAERDYLYTHDSVHVTSSQDTVTAQYAVASSEHPAPFFADIFAPWQAALQHALQPEGKKKFGILSGKQVRHYTVQGTAPGSLELQNTDGDFGPIHAAVDKEGVLEKFDMTPTTDKFVVQRVSAIDIKEFARNSAAREQLGNALGPLSPRDSVRATVDGVTIIVDYGRPAVRGRTIFGNVVPWNVIWRTGANGATQLITSKDLVFGTTVVPAGTYSLFTLPSQDRWLLIINRQHGQWGTVYDQSKDLARIPLELKQLDNLIERFTFEITSEGSRAVLRFKWEKTEASVSFTVK